MNSDDLYIEQMFKEADKQYKRFLEIVALPEATGVFETDPERDKFRSDEFMSLFTENHHAYEEMDDPLSFIESVKSEKDGVKRRDAFIAEGLSNASLLMEAFTKFGTAGTPQELLGKLFDLKAAPAETVSEQEPQKSIIQPKSFDLSEYFTDYYYNAGDATLPA